MGKITINELSNSLKDHIDSKQDAVDNLLETNDKTVVGAINELFQNANELFQSANSGKQLIANAIGEPLSADDTFQAMSDKITGILNDIKNKLESKGIDISNFNDLSSVIDMLDVMHKVVVVAGDTHTLYSQSDSGSTWADGSTHTYTIPSNFTVPEAIKGLPIESLKATIRVQSGLSDGSGNAMFTVQVNNEPAVAVTNAVLGSTTSVVLNIGPIKAGDVIKVILGSASSGRYRYYGFSITGDIKINY